MPISIDEFESSDLPSGPSVPEQVISFLAVHADKAFTRAEIAMALDEDPNTVSTSLSRLADRSLVRHKGEYWTITDDNGRLGAAYDLHSITAALNDEDGGIAVTEWNDVAPDTPHPSEQQAANDGEESQ